MLELLTNAWQGWQRYTDNGKYAALLVLVLLFLWFRREEKQKVLLIYTTLVAVLCIFPVSAAVLMAYQTRFYDYEWIWNYVPVTLMIAYGGTVFLTGCWKSYQKSIWKCAGMTLAVLAVVVLCGSLDSKAYEDAVEYPEDGQVQALLAVVAGEAAGQEICLWAPENVMASARAYDGNIRLIYGRDMWDAALGGYSYDTYGEVEEKLYLWMCNVEETGTLEYALGPESAGAAEEAVPEAEKASAVVEAENAGADAEAVPETENVIDGAWCVEAARAAGVNRIVLPGNIEAEALGQLAETAQAEVVQYEEYYLLKIG